MAQVSSESRNSFRKIVRAAVAETRVHKKLWIITLVLYGVALLLFAFDVEYYWTGKAYDNSGTAFEFQPSVAGVIFAAFGVMVGFFAALNVFNDMHNRQLCDISMALPLRAGERFFSRLLSLFFLQVAPLLVSTLLGNALAILVGFLREGSFPGMQSVTIFTFPLLFLAGSLFIMAITVLCACCCGAMAESAYFSLILMFIINFLPQSFFTHLYETCAGYQQTGFLHYTSEGHDFLQNWGFLYLFTTDAEKLIPHCLVGSLISLAVMLLSGLIYRKRDARTVGTPIASRVFFEIMMFLGCVTVFSFFAFEDEALWGVLVAAVIYIIINVIVSRAKIGVKSVLLWVGKYLATTAVCAAVFTAASVTGGFGAIALRPEARYLEGASFSIYCYNSNAPDLHTDPLSAEQADQVMEIYKKHVTAGRKALGAAFVWRKYPDETGWVGMFARSNVTYPERPSPQWQFREHYVTEQFPSGRVEIGDGEYLETEGGYASVPDGKYYLDFSQRAQLSDAEAEAMREELLALDFVYEREDTEIRAQAIDAKTYEGQPLDPATGLPLEVEYEYP